jgi:starch synthase
MSLLSHPSGNANVRAVLEALDRAGLLAKFVTTLGWSHKSYPYLSDHIRGKLRRNYELPADKIVIHPLREAVRLLAGISRAKSLTRHETGWASIDQVGQNLDRETARRIRGNKCGPNLRGVYA